jgi:hypothetical protein
VGRYKLYSKLDDAPKIEDLVKKFFQYNYGSCVIVSATLQDNTWSVKVNVTVFGNQSSKTLTIDSKTGKIISVNESPES